MYVWCVQKGVCVCVVCVLCACVCCVCVCIERCTCVCIERCTCVCFGCGGTSLGTSLQVSGLASTHNLPMTCRADAVLQA